ncbi:LysM peptidoglycan-binding domain-containing protein [Nocardioides rubriscoriae]|uniref:LysM peptidoglycan-binding domain-containing protein n=1 Tax=Nocardioides rubriscoriae TaxID=642762 RepID=UPI0011DFFBEF|nr:LysM peptidoglycan-binding domain-containing protein [Nocardioides rubriscoriae]
MSQPTLRQRLRGLAATLVILLLVAGVPFLLIAIGAAPWKADLAVLRTLLTIPDDGTLAMVVIAAVAWIAWAFVAVSVVLEIVSQVRGLPTPTLPGLGTPQRAVGQLVAVAALLFVAGPTVVAAFPAPPARAAAAVPVLETPRLAPVEATPVLPEAAPLPAAEAPTKQRSTIDYTVKRGDSLWKIAERLLGDGTRFTEIVELNEDVLNGRPDFIVSGTVLKVPQEVTEPDPDRTAEEYVVQPGDTLSEIAEAKLGDPMRYPELFQASRNVVQPDGARLTDPDLIQPGWEIAIPRRAEHQAEVPQEPPVEVIPPVDAGPPGKTPSVEPAPEPTTSAEPQPEQVAADATGEVESSAPGWLVPGLTGAGAVLAALVLLAVRAHRSTQLRYRRPGQTIAPPPEGLLAVEKTAFVSGAPLITAIADLDRALMHLAGECSDAGRALPAVVTATLMKGAVSLRLDEDADLPEPWRGAGREWSLPLGEPMPERGDVLPPYPLLVTVGQDNNGLRLVNLEHLGVVALAGDSERTGALARHIAAELALNPWSTIVEVNVIGLGEELATLDTLRLRHHADGEQVVPSFVRDVTTSLEHGMGDPDPYRAVITAGDGTGDLAPLLATPPSRVGTAIVSLAAPLPESTVFEVDHAGRLRAPTLGLDLQAAGLTSEEAKACAAIVDLTRESEPVRVPPFEQAADGWRAFADQAGALRDELTDAREEGPAGDGSLLPDAAEDYVEAAATTVQDVEALAPLVPDQVRRTVEDADPTLDEDVADWFDAGVERPRLILLGPVNAEAFGEAKPVILKRRPYFVEILAYLALHPKGATASQVADAFGIAASRARTDVSSLRDWLGMNPRTKGPYLPAANESPAYFESGVKTYQLQDVLVDVDLFRRLRARGEARGAAGIDDLRTAMSLVQGPPFSLLREKGWSWLLDTERVHETIGCAIVDTAHILVLDALAKGDLHLAREVAEAACEAAPYDDICRLDLVKVAAAEGHDEAADKMLYDDVLNRTDDYLPPIDLPGRTAKVTEDNGWTGPSRRAK